MKCVKQSANPARHRNLNKPQHQLKPFMAIADFNRRIDKAITHRSEGTINYALENLYVGANQILCIDHAPGNNTEEERT